MSKSLTCIVCPMGCRITVNGEDVKGHGCVRGKDWAVQEFTNPVRILTTTIALEGGELDLLPVRTETYVPRSKLLDCIGHANCLRVKAPVTVGQVICADVAGTGVKMTASRTIGSSV